MTAAPDSSPRGDGAAVPSLVICTPSYRRRALLLELLAALDAQIFTRVTPPRIAILIVDNSPDHDLADLAAAPQGLSRWPVTLVSETVPGLTAARNRLLDEADRLAPDFLVFVDDDERPRPDWLDRLLADQRAHDADIVTGTVHGQVPASAPGWMARGGFFTHAPQPAFRGVSGSHTATTLVRRAAVARAGARFEAAFALTGGEDTMFFTRLEMAGAKAVECPEAVVDETVPADRARLSWLWRRWSRTGSSEARLVLIRDGAKGAGAGAGVRARLVAGGLARVASGLLKAAALSPLALVGRFDLAAHALKTAARGTGFVLGALDRDVVEYKRA
jgi:GT2 family glycosyltransferase